MRFADKITAVYRSYAPIVCKDLNIEVPELVFKELDARVNASIFVDIWSEYYGAIVRTETESTVYFNPSEMSRVANAFLLPTLAINALIRFVIAHELRHVWQAKNGFFDGLYVFKPEDKLGYGYKPEELDADNYALSMTRNFRERAICSMKVAASRSSDIVGYAEFNRAYNMATLVNDWPFCAVAIAAVLFLR